jgi:hypothetical protein
MSLQLSVHFHGLQRGPDDSGLDDLYVEVSFEQLARDRFASIHLVAEKGYLLGNLYLRVGRTKRREEIEQALMEGMVCVVLPAIPPLISSYRI